MDDSKSTELQALLDRVQGGDREAVNQLVDRTYERLRRLAKKMLHQDFPRLRNAHGTLTVLHGAAVRLLPAVPEVRPATVNDFFRLAAIHFRRTLLNLARRYDRKEGRLVTGAAGSDESQESPAFEPNESTRDPVKLSEWTAFHEAIAKLPDEQRMVVEHHFYFGASLTETAKLLSLSKHTVRRHWTTFAAVCPIPDA